MMHHFLFLPRSSKLTVRQLDILLHNVPEYYSSYHIYRDWPLSSELDIDISWFLNSVLSHIRVERQVFVTASSSCIWKLFQSAFYNNLLRADEWRYHTIRKGKLDSSPVVIPDLDPIEVLLS